MNTPNSFPLITSKDFQNGAIDFTNAKYISAEDHFEIIKRSNTEKGDVLMSMIGGNIGNLMYVDTDRQFSIKNVALFKTSHNKALARFLFYYLKSNLLRTQIDLNSRGGAQGFLGLSDLRKLVFPKVPQSEMEEIVSYLDTVIGRLQHLITTIQLSIEKLKEYRQSIITEAVTGQIALVDWDNQNKKLQFV
jgi:type I restriction enzyme S subunit